VTVSILLSETEVNDEEFVTVSSDAHDEVVWLDVSVDEVLTMDVLNAADHLIGQHQDSLHSETSRAEIKQIFQTRTEQLHDEGVVVPGLTEPADVGDTHPSLEDLIELALIEQLGVTSLDRL